MPLWFYVRAAILFIFNFLRLDIGGLLLCARTPHQNKFGARQVAPIRHFALTKHEHARTN